MDNNHIKNKIIEVSHKLLETGLVRRTWGNLSQRASSFNFAITPSGIDYNRIEQDMIPLVKMDSLSYVGSTKPSSEAGMHSEIYKMRPDVDAIIHTHQTYGTIIGLNGFQNILGTDEHGLYISDPVKYSMPGSKELWKAVAEKSEKGYNVILMERHGVVILGSMLEECLSMAIRLEQLCKTAVEGVPQDEPRIVDPQTNKELYDKIYHTIPESNKLLMYSSRSVEIFGMNHSYIPSINDDFAQIVGIDIKPISEERFLKSNKSELEELFHMRSAVWIKNKGIITIGENEEDCLDIITLIEKNLKTAINGEAHGKVIPLDTEEATLLRSNYIHNYSKLK